MTIMIEFTEGHYEVQETSYGKDYVWCPEHVLVECDCGQKLVLSPAETVCRCGVDHVALVEEELASRGASDGPSHPWDAEYREWRRNQDDYLVSEKTYQLELSRLD